MWADGVKGRKDGLKWVREDFGVDGMHPSNSGREKVARMLLQFLKTDPTSKPWFLANGTPGAAQGLDPGAIRQKVQRGEQLTPEERQFIQQRPASQNQQNAQQRRAQYLKEHPPQSSLGLIPLTDLGSGAYKGEEGGLYPGGKNSPPAGHLQAGVALARQIAPLDADGKRSADGKIALLSIGFSNPSIEFPAFQKLLNEDAAVNPRLVTVNGCVGSQAASVIGDPNSGYWNTVDQRLSAAGVTRHQVQAVWLKEVNPGPSQPFPVESKKLYNDLISTLHNLQDRFPNLKVAYLSSRTYGGYTELGGSPEPWAYETGFAVKWVVSDQIAGKPEVNYDPSKGAVRSPWIEWGPYLWTDGVKGRQDGFVYLREDLGEDGLHPSEKGSAKIASLMMNFFKTDPATRIWFLKVGQAAGQQPSQKQIQYGYGPMDWVEPDTTPVEGTAYKIFHSKTIQADVNYLVYLPPDYEQQQTTRYPVLYELPASGQTTKGGAEIVRRVDQGIRAGRISPMIIVLVNGLRGNTMYCDSRDGRYPLETVIVKDLVPHVDAAYRTVASREGRGLDGFSMGGFGAAHLGLKYPDVFGVLSIMAPPLLGPELTQQLPKQAWSRLFPTAMAGDPDYFRANDPFTLVEKNAGKLRDRTVIRIVAHMEDQQWLWPQCEKLHKLMAQHMIQHEFYFLTNVKSHNRAQCLNTMGEGAVAFFSSSLLRPAANGQAPARTAAAPGPDEKWESFPDGSTGRAVEFHGVGGAAIPAYIRKPKGSGPIPVVVMAHGGRYGKAPTEGMGRSTKSPTQDFIDAGWAVYSIDYRPSEKIAIVPIEFDDTVEAVQTVRKFPFIDASRVGYMGGSHGAQVLKYRPICLLRSFQRK